MRKFLEKIRAKFQKIIAPYNLGLQLRQRQEFLSQEIAINRLFNSYENVLGFGGENFGEWNLGEKMWIFRPKACILSL